MNPATLKTLAVAAVTLALVVGVGFGVQAAALGRPGRDRLLVVQAVAKLVSFHRSSATMTFDGRHLHTVCTQDWKHAQRTATVAVSRGPTLTEVGDELTKTGAGAVGEFELAGCPRTLAKWLAAQLNSGAPLEVKPTRMDGRQVYSLRFLGSQLKLRLYVNLRGALPVALTLSGRGVRGTSRLRYGLASPLSVAGPAEAP